MAGIFKFSKKKRLFDESDSSSIDAARTKARHEADSILTDMSARRAKMVDSAPDLTVQGLNKDEEFSRLDESRKEAVGRLYDAVGAEAKRRRMVAKRKAAAKKKAK